jgi:uncharacterized membrane protein YkoI
MRSYLLFFSIGLTVLACNRPSPAGTQSGAAVQYEIADLPDSAKVDSVTARRTALAKVPNGRVLQQELERDGGRLVWSFDIKSGSKPGVEEVQVDALDGSVVSVLHESAADEAAEAKKEGTS